MAIFRKSIKMRSTVDSEADLITSEEREVSVSLFGIRISHTAYKRKNEPYEGEPLVKKNGGLGFKSK